MDKATAIKSFSKISSLKPLFPVLLGFLFIFFLFYILYAYDAHEKVNTYAHTLEVRNGLLEKYNLRYNQMISELTSVDSGRPASENLTYLDTAYVFNEELIELSNSIHLVSSGMQSSNSDEESLISAYVKADYTRVLLHQNLREFLEGQKQIAQYLMIKSESEACFADVDLGSTTFNAQTAKIKRCLNLFSKESDFISNLSENFIVTSQYLSEYSKYWNTVLEMFTALEKNETNIAKQASERAKTSLQSVNELLKDSEEEMNSVIVNNPREKVDEMTEQLRLQNEEILLLEGAI